jgi:hypothetical protein
MSIRVTETLLTGKAIGTFRKEVQKLGLLTVKGHKWIVGYSADFY